jgi:hypothetical protein
MQSMRTRTLVIFFALTVNAFAFACGGGTTSRGVVTEPAKPKPTGPAALPNEAFKAQITLIDPPAKLRAGQTETLKLHVKNASSVTWWMRGAEINPAVDNKFYIAAGYHWLDKDGKTVAALEGHNAIPKDLKAGEETDMTLQVTAPKDPGEYTLEVDMVQEQVAWFKEKGSTTATSKVTVGK